MADSHGRRSLAAGGGTRSLLPTHELVEKHENYQISSSQLTVSELVSERSRQRRYATGQWPGTQQPPKEYLGTRLFNGTKKDQVDIARPLDGSPAARARVRGRWLGQPPVLRDPAGSEPHADSAAARAVGRRVAAGAHAFVACLIDLPHDWPRSQSAEVIIFATAPVPLPRRPGRHRDAAFSNLAASVDKLHIRTPTPGSSRLAPLPSSPPLCPSRHRHGSRRGLPARRPRDRGSRRGGQPH